jgi:gliding motility-associated-like protein
MNTKLFITLLIANGLSGLIYAQKEGNVWHFGHGQTINFNSGVPVQNGVSEMVTFEGCASWSDANGNLLFYTNGGGRLPNSGQDGGKIWNRNHQVMYDMQGTQGGGFSAAQSSVVIPKPGQSDQFYLFTMEEVEYNLEGEIPGQVGGRGLSYFEIDMTLNGGLGGVTNYVQTIYGPIYESVCAVRHTNGTDYWIVVQNVSGYGVTCVPVTSSGVGAPVEHDFGFVVFSGIEASPNGKKMVFKSDDQTVIVDFDATTGTFGQADSTIQRQGNCEFSPNSQRLLMVQGDKFRSFDLNAPNIAASEYEIGWFTGGGTQFVTRMQLASDGRIYVANIKYPAGKTYMTAIVCPNSATPTLAINVLQLPDTENLFFGLPNFPDHLFAQDDPPLPITASNDTTICAGSAANLMVNQDPTWTYSWSNGAQTPEISVDEAGFYKITVTDGCRFGYDSVSVSVNSIGSVTAFADNVICAGSTMSLNGNVPTGSTITWTAMPPNTPIANPQALATTATPTSTSIFILTATLDGCTASDTTAVFVEPFVVATLTPPMTTIELGETVALTASGGQNYVWSPAEGLSCADCANPVASPTETQTYQVIVSAPGSCPDTLQAEIVVILPDCNIKIPTAFTPEQTENDLFGPVSAYNDMTLSIFSRWGQNIYTGTTNWNGQYNGVAAPPDVYFYKINLTDECGQKKAFTGEVTLIR